MVLYHGTAAPQLKTLDPLSRLHGDGSPVLYLTSSIPYSLFYIWDTAHTGSMYKFITCGLRNGVVIYEEQFPDQLKKLYRGASGFIYSVHTDSAEQLPNRESIYYARSALTVSDVTPIPDVYESILSYAEQGQIHVIPYSDMPEDRKKLFREHYQKLFADLSNGSNREQQRFYSTYFPELWPKKMP